MPAAAPPVDEANRLALALIGQRIRERRKALAVSAVAAAEAAGLSRVTLHRIERGEPSVSLGAYQNALAAVGLALAVVPVDAASPAPADAPSPAGPQAPRATKRRAALPPGIRLADYPQLHRLAWQVPGSFELTPAEALGLYERLWRHLAPDTLAEHEQHLLDELKRTAGQGHLLV